MYDAFATAMAADSADIASCFAKSPSVLKRALPIGHQGSGICVASAVTG